jgi:hypothetical protein
MRGENFTVTGFQSGHEEIDGFFGSFVEKRKASPKAGLAYG